MIVVGLLFENFIVFVGCSSINENSIIETFSNEQYFNYPEIKYTFIGEEYSHHYKQKKFDNLLLEVKEIKFLFQNGDFVLKVREDVNLRFLADYIILMDPNFTKECELDVLYEFKRNYFYEYELLSDLMEEFEKA